MLFTALFQSLLYEACGRTVNPVNGAVGLLSTGNWHLCQAAVETVLAGGTLRPVFGVGVASIDIDESSESFRTDSPRVQQKYAKSKPSLILYGSNNEMVMDHQSDYNSSDLYLSPISFGSSEEVSEVSGSWGSGGYDGIKGVGGKEPKLLNLFV